MLEMIDSRSKSSNQLSETSPQQNIEEHFSMNTYTYEHESIELLIAFSCLCFLHAAPCYVIVKLNVDFVSNGESFVLIRP